MWKVENYSAGMPRVTGRIDRTSCAVPFSAGTRVRVALPADRQDFEPGRWARAFSLFNPHALVQICVSAKPDEEAERAHSDNAGNRDLYQPTVTFPGSWRKFLPTDLPSPWWYDLGALEELIFARIAAARRGAKDLTLREFVRQFRGLSRSAEAKLVCDQFPDVARLTDFDKQPERIHDLLRVMRRTAKPPKPDILGAVGKDHFRRCFEQWYGVKRFWYR